MRFWKTGLADLAIAILAIKSFRRDDVVWTIELSLRKFELKMPDRSSARCDFLMLQLQESLSQLHLKDSKAEFELRYGAKPRVLPALTDMKYDPISGTFYSPSAIRLTMRQLNDKIEGYLHKLVLDLMRSQTNARH